MSESHRPVLIGAGQVVQKDVDLEEADGPLELMKRACEVAAEDAAGGKALLDAVDTLGVVNVLCWDLGDAPRLLAEALGITPARRFYTTVGGDTPQRLLNHACDLIAEGRAEAVLLAGVETFHTGRAYVRAGQKPPWPQAAGSKPEVLGSNRQGSSDIEWRHDLQRPAEIYPLFENAIRAHLGRGLDDHRLQLGRLYEGFTRVAAANPYAWFRAERSAEEIATPNSGNRYVGFPYTKLMNAIMMVDQSAAVILTSVAKARALGIDSSRWVYPLGGAEAHDRWYVSERSDFHSSPAIREASRAAMEMADVEVSELSLVDLYSCFPSAVQIGLEETGLAAVPPRPLTLTGGLAYHGGPGNNYAMHGIAQAVDALRADRGAKAMTTALGWYMTKHAVGVYGGEPGPRPWVREDPQAVQRSVDALPSVAVASDPSGPAEVETYSVCYGRDSEPRSAAVFARLQSGERAVAVIDTDPSILAHFTEAEGVGLCGRVHTHDGVTKFMPS